jgi:hypothetical protein
VSRGKQEEHGSMMQRFATYMYDHVALGRGGGVRRPVVGESWGRRLFCVRGEAARQRVRRIRAFVSARRGLIDETSSFVCLLLERPLSLQCQIFRVLRQAGAASITT